MSFQRMYILCLSALLSMGIAWAAHADDLEIYLGTGNQSVTYNPNVLFIMDTSGSMSNKDGSSQTRLLRVQNALKDALGSATNINAGLMRFSDSGGPILFPVKDIDEYVKPELVLSVSEGEDDAVEIAGTVALSDTVLPISQGTAVVHTGLRYQNIAIPKGATITRAFLRLTSAAVNSNETSIHIYGQLNTNATVFSGTDPISSRPRTTESVVWEDDNEFGFTNEVHNSPDLSAVIQNIVDQSAWCGGNDLALLLQTQSLSGSSARQTFSFESGTGQVPQLVIEYDDSSATGCVAGELVYQVSKNSNNAEERDNGYQSTGSELTFKNTSNAYIGLRFSNINLPQGAVINHAHLEFTAYQNGTGSSANMLIEGVNQDDPDDFSPYPRYVLRDKPKTVSVEWANIEPWYYKGLYQSPAVTAIVQQIVNRAGWEPNNEMMFVLSNFGSSKRGGFTYQGKPSGAAKLIIEYHANAIPGSSSTVRELLQSKVDSLTHTGYTPIVDTLYEAAQYFGGRQVQYGLQRGTSSASSTLRKSTRVSHRQSYTGADPVRPSGCDEDNLSDSDCINESIPSPATYISPVTDLQCQTNNHIVLLSDGVANNNHSVSEIQTLLNHTCSGSGGEKCGLDLVDNLSQSNTSVIDARVLTHTIGFAANTDANDFLNQLALHGGGGFYQADDSQQLVDAFQQILRSVKDVNATFVSPGVAVNQLNRLTHKDELYFALFKPSEGAIWPGNLKKYKINGNAILDKNGVLAVDNASGFFSEYSHSFWSVLADGNNVRDGGAASRLSLTRNVYTFAETGSILQSANQLHESNVLIDTTDLALTGLPDPSGLRQLVLKWARGVDVRDDDGDGSTSDVRFQMGDPIHSQPVIVNYSETDSAVFVATNHGFLHSIDAQTGSENFSIIPQDLLGNLYSFYQDTSTFNHIYGMDGDLVLRTYGEKIYLYVGMRRGGSNYYVFDVTSKLDPKLVFSIKGGEGEYTRLGQTWSRPTLTKIRIGTTIKDVMIVGGGYDDSQDSKSVRSADSIGNAIYIIDANTGTKLYEIAPSDADLTISSMQYAIPGRISTIDRDADGLADHLYAADVGGQVFRFDIYNGATGSSLVKGGVLADFNGDTPISNRRFYYGPDVTEVATGEEQYFAVALGSGFRAGPLNTEIQDSFYMIKDEGVYLKDEYGHFTLPTTPYTPDSLYNATSHQLTASDTVVKEVAQASFRAKQGWWIALQSGGEKVLSSPLILDYQVFFTTYLPASASDSACAPPAGNARAYLVDLLTGNAVVDLNQDTLETHSDRFALLNQTGIAPDTKILIENIVQPVVCLGAECTSAVIEYDMSGQEIACLSDFACLAQNIYGRFERVQPQSWTTEIERQP